jgi:Fructose-2,6-bisphosphatase
MRNIYIVRHGRTDWNDLGKMQGQEDIPLNNHGQKQAEQLSVFFENNQIECIYTSPLSRASETAAIINKVTNVEIKEECHLMERNFGKASGGSLADYLANSNIGNISGLESLETVQKRVLTSFQKMLAETTTDFLIVSHGVAIEQLIQQLGLPFDLTTQTQGIIFTVVVDDKNKVLELKKHDMN